MANLDYIYDNPRLVFVAELPADTTYTLEGLIRYFIDASDNDLFDDDVAKRKFLQNISWNIRADQSSSIGRRGGAGSLYYITRFINPSTGVQPSGAGYFGTYGVEIADGTERTVSGAAQNLLLYSEAGTNVLIDICFETGA